MCASEFMAEGCTFADIPDVRFPATVVQGIARRMRHPKMALDEFQVLRVPRPDVHHRASALQHQRQPREGIAAAAFAKAIPAETIVLNVGDDWCVLGDLSRIIIKLVHHVFVDKLFICCSHADDMLITWLDIICFVRLLSQCGYDVHMISSCSISRYYQAVNSMFSCMC